MNNALSLIVLNLSLSSYLMAVIVGSDLVPTRERAVVFSATDNQILAFAVMQQGFTLKDSNAYVSYNSYFPVSGNVDLNGGILKLEQDLIFRDPAAFVLGNVSGNGHTLELSSGMTQLGVPNNAPSKTFNFDNLTLVLNNNVVLENAHLNFSGKSVVCGQGHALILGKNSSITVDKNSLLRLKNLRVRDVNGNNIQCLDDSGKIFIEDSVWNLNGNYTFAKGSFDVLNQFEVLGENCTFAYKTNQTSSVNSQGKFRLGRGVIFYYDPASSAKSLIKLIDASSCLQLDGATLSSNATGMALTKGKIIVDCKSYIYNNALNDAQALSIGDGKNPTNNATVQWLPAATLEVTKGRMLYNNV